MIVEQIPKCNVLADIGTDHAYVPIYAVKRGLCEKALAVDVKTGPLESAAINIKRHGLEKHIEIRQGNGLESVQPFECDVVVIAGMGGLLIRDILSSSVEKARAARLLLLQPNCSAEALRKWLYENGFAVTCEKLVKDAGKIYCVIESKWDGKCEKKDEFIYYVGEKVFIGNEFLIKEYLGKKLRDAEAIIEGRSRKAKKAEKADKESSFSKSSENGPVVPETGTEKDYGGEAGDSGESERLSEMSTEVLVRIRDRIKEHINLL